METVSSLGLGRLDFRTEHGATVGWTRTMANQNLTLLKAGLRTKSQNGKTPNARQTEQSRRVWTYCSTPKKFAVTVAIGASCCTSKTGMSSEKAIDPALASYSKASPTGRLTSAHKPLGPHTNNSRHGDSTCDYW